MLLALSKPVRSEFDYTPHDYSPPFPPSKAARYSPKLNGGPPPSSALVPPFTMGTPHRGLPPPAAMTLPDPGRGPSSMAPPLGSMPPAPPQWQGAEDGMKNWLAAKAEEERRRQEEERTRQESLKLEQRKIEQSMLRESMQGGVPPHLVPIIFAGIGGGSLASISAEWIQQYAATIQAQVHAQTQLSPDISRDSRMIGQSSSTGYAGQPQSVQTVLSSTSALPGQSQQDTNAYGGMMSPRARAAQSASILGSHTSASRLQTQLPRLTTGEMSIQHPPTAPLGSQQLQSQSAQQEQSSPSIYFHHWVPPSSSAQDKTTSSNLPATPAGKHKVSPVYQPRQRATSHASDLEHTNSPRKRKAQGAHPPPPPPTSVPQSHTSPSFSHISASSTSTPGQRGHGRGRSDTSPRQEEASSAPGSRRGTISGLKGTMRHSEVSDETRYSDPRLHPQFEQAHATSLPSDRRASSQPHYAQSSKPETVQYGSQPHWDRAYMSSPKREA